MTVAVVTTAAAIPPHPLTKIGFAVLADVFSGIPSLALLRFTLDSRIVANRSGLRFHGFLKTRFIPWQAIEDYELRSRPGHSDSRVAYIQVAGEWRKLWPWLRPYDDLLEVIQAQARWSKAREWRTTDTT